MPKLSVLIPSRQEKFLFPTICDCFAKSHGEIEVVVHLDGYWPEGWGELTAQYPNLHTVHSGAPVGMRRGINNAAGSAIQRGAKWLMKADAHVMFDEGFDVKLLAEIEPNWIVVPRRKRLDAENWCLQDVGKPDIDYHYLSFPDDPADFGGKGLNGKVWDERIRQRLNKPEYDLDDEMSSQGSLWVTSAAYFQQLELMDESSYGPFWNEMQEIGLKAWLSGGALKVNKRTWYAHLHKGKNYKGADGQGGRGYKLPESWLQTGRNHTLNWIYNEAWPKQTLPFSWLIEHFWPVPSWPDNWEEILYATRKPRTIANRQTEAVVSTDTVDSAGVVRDLSTGLVIHQANYGIRDYVGDFIDVTERLQSLVKDNSLDIVVNNSTLTPGQNPFRGKKKRLHVVYSIDGREYGDRVERFVDEKDWLIIGPVRSRDDATGNLPIEKVEAGLRQGILEPELIQTNEGLQEVAVYVGDKTQSTGFTEKICSYCQQEQRVFQDGTFVVHFKESELATLRDIDSPKCPGSSKKYKPPSLAVFESQSGVRKLTQLAPDALPMTAPALNDYLIRKFQISPQRLRGPMPIELRDFHRNDLAQLFAELGFKRMVEVGVAEGHFSEVLLKANPEAELILVDPWGDVEGNAQNKGSNRHKFAYEETKRKTAPYPNVRILKNTSMGVVGGFLDNSFDAAYLDANHSYPFIMEDLINWTRKVRSGGIVAGDDAFKLDEKRWGAGPMEAIFDYTRAMRISPWWLIDAPRSVDFFFVKP